MNAFYLTILFLCLVATNPAKAQEKTSPDLHNELSVLNGRASFSFPDSAKNIAREVDIMSADRNMNQETRIICDSGDQRLVFFARELFCLGSENLYDAISKEQDENYQFKRQLLSDKNGVISILSTPTKFNTYKGGILINSLLVRASDQTVFRVDAYINPAAFSQVDQYIELTGRVFGTMKPGKRTVDLHPHNEKVEIFGTDKSFLIPLPENYAISVDQKYDFQVIRIHKYLQYEDTNWLELTIYTGHYPSYFYPDYGFENQPKTEKGKFLKETIDWYCFEDPSQPVFIREQKIPVNTIEEGLVAHVAMVSNCKQAMDEMRTIVEAVRLAN